MRTTLDPKNDCVFKLLFANPANKPSLIRLLTAVLHPPSPIVEVTVLNPEIPRVLPDDRGIALDIHVVLGDGTHVDVEMQQACHAFLAERILYYWARICGASVVKGKQFSALRPCVSVIFVGEPLLPGSRFHSIFRVLETHGGYPLCNDLAIHIIELPKLGLAEPDDADVAEWGSFLTAQTDEELKDLTMTHPNLDEAITALENLSVDASYRELVLQHDLAIANLVIMRQGCLVQGREEGREEGRAEGLVEAIRSLANVLLLSLNDDQEQKLAKLKAGELESLLRDVRTHRTWPEGWQERSFRCRRAGCA
jgi:predicted transposase/invertase (TIGR01784 family)